LGQTKEAEEVALIDLGADKTGIHFFKGENLEFYREVTPAGADITRAIMDGLGSGEESKVLYEKAENIKEMLGISSEGSEEKIPGALRQAQDESINVSKIIFYMRPILERMVAEIGRSLDYYKNQFNVDRIDRVLLTGGGAHLKNFFSYLQRELRLPVEHFNPLKEILFDSKKIPARRQAGIAETLDQMGSRFMVAAGLALPQPKRIELLPALEPVITKARIVKAIPILAPLIALLVFLVIIWDMSAQVASIKRERDAKVGKVANIETLQTKLTSLKEEEQRLKEELSRFPSALMVSVPHGEILKEITHIVPDNVTLKLVSVQAKGKSLKREVQASKSQEGESQQDQETELHITGIAFGSDIQFLTALAHIIGGLDKSPLFKNAKLMSADENKLYNRPGAEFKIVCDIVADHQNRKVDQ
jgi:cell division ATPase FtsA